MRNFKLILFLFSLFLICDFCFFDGVVFARRKKNKKSKTKTEKVTEEIPKGLVIGLLGDDKIIRKSAKKADRKRKKEEKDETVIKEEIKDEEKVDVKVGVEEKKVERKKEIEELKKKKKLEIDKAKDDRKIYAAARKKVEQRRREAAVRAEVRDVDVAEEVKREVEKQKAWNALEKSGAAVHMKEYVKLAKRSEDANDFAEITRIQSNIAKTELDEIIQTKGEASPEAVKAQSHFDRISQQANKANQDVDKLKKDIGVTKEAILIKLEESGQDSDIVLKDVVPGKTSEEQMEKRWKELEASGIITEAKVRTEQEEIEVARKIEKEEEKIKKLEARLAQITKLPKEEQNPFGDVKQALKGDIIKARQKAAGLKTGILKGGEIGKLVSLEKKANKLKGKPGKQKEYEEVVRQKDDLEEQLSERIKIAKGINEEEENLLNAKIMEQVSDLDVEMLKKELAEVSTEPDRKKAIEKELAEIVEGKKIVEDYINQKILNESKKRALTDDEVAKIREDIYEELTKKAERLIDVNRLINDAKKDIIEEQAETKKEVKKMAMTTGMKFAGVFPSIFMAPPEVGEGEEGVEGGEGGLTEEQLELLKKRRMMQAAG